MTYAPTQLSGLAPAGPSLLLLLCFPCMSPTLPRRSVVPSRCTHTTMSGFLELSTSRHPPLRLCQQCRRAIYFGAASFTLCYDLHVCLALLTGYDEMKSHALHAIFPELHSIARGYTGPGVKTAIPPAAEAKISMRLVPRQNPGKDLQTRPRFYQGAQSGCESLTRIVPGTVSWSPRGPSH